MNTQILAGYIAFEVAGPMKLSALESFVKTPQLHVWLTNDGFIQSSSQAAWPCSAEGVPLIGANIIRMEIDGMSVMQKLTPDATEEEAKANGELAKRALIRSIYSQALQFVTRNPHRVPDIMNRAALGQIDNIKIVLNFIGEPKPEVEDSLNAYH